jgi:hypothetical protein
MMSHVFCFQVDLREGEDLQQREYPQMKQSHTRETHDDIIFRSRSAKETARKVATEGIQADSKARRQADNKSYLVRFFRSSVFFQELLFLR